MIGRTNALSGGGSVNGLNFTVKAYSTLPASGKENEIAVITSTPMTGYFVAAEDLYIGEVNLLEGAATTAGYLSSSGGHTAQDSTRKELYTTNAIPVEHGKTYTIEYTLASEKSMRLLINEYNGSTHVQRIEPVASVTGTNQVVKYTPSATNISNIRIAWATYGVSCTVTMLTEKVLAPDGMVWIKTASRSTVEVWADKDQTTLICPVGALICTDGAWEAVDAKCWQDNTWKSLSFILYDYGTENVPITHYSYGGNKSETRIYVRITGTGEGRVYTTNPIDVAGFKTLKAIVQESGQDGTQTIMLGLRNTPTGDYVASTSFASEYYSSGDTLTMSCDVSQYSGTQYYVVLSSTTVNHGWFVYKIWLE